MTEITAHDDPASQTANTTLAARDNVITPAVPTTCPDKRSADRNRMLSGGIALRAGGGGCRNHAGDPRASRAADHEDQVGVHAKGAPVIRTSRAALRRRVVTISGWEFRTASGAAQPILSRGCSLP